MIVKFLRVSHPGGNLNLRGVMLWCWETHKLKPQNVAWGNANWVFNLLLRTVSVDSIIGTSLQLKVVLTDLLKIN